MHKVLSVTAVATLLVAAAVLLTTTTTSFVDAFHMKRDPLARLKRSSEHGNMMPSLRSVLQREQQQTQAGRYVPLRGSSTPGAFFSAHSSLFTVVGPWLNNYLVSYLNNNWSMPTYNYADGSFIINFTDIAVHKFECENCISLSLQDGYAGLDISGLGVSVSLSLNYNAHWHFLHSSGSCSPVVDSLTTQAQVRFGPPNPINGTPTVVVSVQQFNVGDVTLDCTGLAGHFAAALIDVVKHLLGSVFNRVFSDAITNEANEELANLSLVIPFKGAIADFDLVPGSTDINGDRIRIGVEGVFVPASNPNITFPFPPPSSISDSCDGGMVALGLTMYSLQTLGFTFFQLGSLSATFPNLIKAKDLLLIVPGFAEKLGSDAELNITISAASYPTFVTNTAAQSLTVTVPLNFSIVGAQSSFYDVSCLGTAAASLVIVNGAQPGVTFSIPSLSLSQPKETSSNVGKGALPLLITLLDNVISKYVLAPFNDIMKAFPIPLPTIEGFAVTSGAVKYNPASVCVELNIKNVD